MSTQAQYATKARIGKVRISVANTNRDGTGTLGVLATASPVKGASSRIDRISIQATATTTAGMLRFFLVKGRPGETITSIAFSTTTATVTTNQPHGRVTGDKITMLNALPDQYNVVDTAITVISPTTFSYTMASAPTINAQASDLGGYAWTPSTIDASFFREVSVTAATPSASVQTFSGGMSSTNPVDQSYLPLIMEAGYSLRVSTHNAESFDLEAQIGDTA